MHIVKIYAQYPNFAQYWLILSVLYVFVKYSVFFFLYCPFYKLQLFIFYWLWIQLEFILMFYHMVQRLPISKQKYCKLFNHMLSFRLKTGFCVSTPTLSWKQCVHWKKSFTYLLTPINEWVGFVKGWLFIRVDHLWKLLICGAPRSL